MRHLSWIVVGCGYTGQRLTQRLLADGAEVTITGRAAVPATALEPLLAGGARYLAIDLDQLGPTTPWPEPGAILLISTPPARTSWGERERRLIESLAMAQPRRIVYLSSTGVYPAGSGGLTSETTPTEPAAEHGKARLAAETAVLDAAAARGIPAVSLRIAGIYGPGRGVIARMCAGSYRIIGDGNGYVSRIHVDDLVSAIIAAATIEPLPHAVVNVADDEPTSSVDYAREVARRLGQPEPPRVPIDQVDPRAAALVGSNRRIDNERLRRDFGVALRYRSWRDSLDELIALETARIEAR